MPKPFPDSKRLNNFQTALPGIYLKTDNIEKQTISRVRRNLALGASRAASKNLLLILHTSNGFNNLGNLLFARS